MNDVISLMPRYHFGHTANNVIASLLQGTNTLVTGMPGFGRVYFPRFINAVLTKESPETVTMSIDTAFLESQDSKEIASHIKEQLGLPRVIDLQSYIENQASQKRVIIILESVTPTTPKEILKFFTTLSQNVKNLSILTVARCSVLRPTLLKSTEGTHLFQQLFVIPPFDEDGVTRMITINNTRFGFNTKPELSKEITRLSGGNPALVISLCMYLSEHNLPEFKSISHALAFPPLLARVQDIASIFFHETLQISERVGIINAEGAIFSKVLFEYLGNFELADKDQVSTTLSPREQRMFMILRENYNTLVEKEKIAKILQIKDNFSQQWAAYKAIERLKGKISNNYSILTIKGRGFILTEAQG